LCHVEVLQSREEMFAVNFARMGLPVKPFVLQIGP